MSYQQDFEDIYERWQNSVGTNQRLTRELKAATDKLQKLEALNKRYHEYLRELSFWFPLELDHPAWTSLGGIDEGDFEDIKEIRAFLAEQVLEHI